MENYLVASSETTDLSYINLLVSSCSIRKSDVEKRHSETKYKGYVNELLEETQ